MEQDRAGELMGRAGQPVVTAAGQQHLRYHDLANRGNGIDGGVTYIGEVIRGLLKREAQHGRLCLQTSEHPYE